jgi:hypothetical protein
VAGAAGPHPIERGEVAGSCEAQIAGASATAPTQTSSVDTKRASHSRANDPGRFVTLSLERIGTELP